MLSCTFHLLRRIQRHAATVIRLSRYSRRPESIIRYIARQIILSGTKSGFSRGCMANRTEPNCSSEPIANYMYNRTVLKMLTLLPLSLSHRRLWTGHTRHMKSLNSHPSLPYRREALCEFRFNLLFDFSFHSLLTFSLKYFSFSFMSFRLYNFLVSLTCSSSNRRDSRGHHLTF